MSLIHVKSYKTTSRFQNSKSLFIGTKEATDENVFIKVRRFDIREEAKMNSELNGEIGFPRFYYYGVHNNECVLITSLLGKNLQNLFFRMNMRFSVKTILMIADQMLQRLEVLYKKGIVHGRISPEHICVQNISSNINPAIGIRCSKNGMSNNINDQKNANEIYQSNKTCDISEETDNNDEVNSAGNQIEISPRKNRLRSRTLSKLKGQFLVNEDNHNEMETADDNKKCNNFSVRCNSGMDLNPNLLYLINFEHSVKFKGKSSFCLWREELKNYENEEFLSVNAHLKEELTPRDDLESLGYMLIYLYKKQLPWSNSNDVISLKMSTLTESLCSDMPEEFLIYMKRIKELTSPNDVPKYVEYRDLFRNLFMRLGYDQNELSYDNKYNLFEWNIQKPISFSFNDLNSNPIERKTNSSTPSLGSKKKSKLLQSRGSLSINKEQINFRTISGNNSRNVQISNNSNKPPQQVQEILHVRAADAICINSIKAKTMRIKSWSVKPTPIILS